MGYNSCFFTIDEYVRDPRMTNRRQSCFWHSCTGRTQPYVLGTEWKLWHLWPAWTSTSVTRWE